MSAGLAASTVTPGNTPPDSSFTVPAIWLCAAASAGRATTHTTASHKPVHSLRYIPTPNVKTVLEGSKSAVNRVVLSRNRGPRAPPLQARDKADGVQAACLVPKV